MLASMQFQAISVKIQGWKMSQIVSDLTLFLLYEISITQSLTKTQL